MTDERKMQIIRGIVPGDEGVTGAVLERILDKLSARKKGDVEAPNSPHNAQEAETGISTRSREKAEESGKESLSKRESGNKPNDAIIANLFNIRAGACLAQSEMELHPNAEYFTAERTVTNEEKADGIKRVTLAFRKFVTEKDGAIVDCVKSGEKYSLAAGIHNGKTVLLEGSQSCIADKVIGVCVRIDFHFEW